MRLALNAYRPPRRALAVIAPPWFRVCTLGFATLACAPLLGACVWLSASAAVEGEPGAAKQGCVVDPEPTKGAGLGFLAGVFGLLGLRRRQRQA